jgi:hypothetical protein
MRTVIWKWCRANIQEGMVLPTWALCVRAVLFPLDFFYWRMGKARGYQWETDTWVIDGVRYSGKFFWLLARAQGVTYRVTRIGETITLERLDIGVTKLHTFSHTAE